MFEVDFIPSEKSLFIVRMCINKRLNSDNLPSCAGRGSRELADKLAQLLLQNSIPAKLIRGPCMNNCKIGPNLKIQGAELFNGVSDESLTEVVDAIKAEVDRRKASAQEKEKEEDPAGVSP